MESTTLEQTATAAYRAISDARDKVAALGGQAKAEGAEEYWRHLMGTYDMLTTALLRVDG